ncbi:integral membrane protein [Penicillium digitatum]|uniref:Integral membrane protein n=1 Tax=Penicillium digitatum TaxID=36651 RepID=A0A7T6XH70_PENDI|nr:integral membrane protein [Penicillium digitatum]
MHPCGFGKEDWTCTVAWVLGVWYSIIALLMGHYGGGLHWWDVPDEKKIPFQKTIYVTMVMYGPTAYLTKVCLLWIMTRVFNHFQKCVRFIKIFMGLMLAYSIPAVIVKIRICSPIAKFWDQRIDGICLDQTSIILTDAVVSVFSDVIILLLPFPLTWTLQVSAKKRMRVMVILGAGGLAVTASIVRLALIVMTGQSADVSRAFMRINMLGNAEVSIGIICTCLPSLSTLIVRIYHKFSSNKATRESKYKMSLRNQSTRSRSDNQMNARAMASSDDDVLMYSLQGNSKIETIIRGNSERGPPKLAFDGIGVTQSVDVSTSVEPL